MTRIDAHLHLWDPAAGIYTWLTEDLGPLHDTFTPEQAYAQMQSAGVEGAILVQAADAAADTRSMLAVAHEHPWVRGVVGWIDLEAPDQAEAALAHWQQSGRLCGIRQLIHDDARDDVLDLPAVRATLKTLATHGLPLDVPDAFPRQLDAAIRAAQDLPELVVVLDHLGKPPRGSDAMTHWEQQVRALAAAPNTVAKVSGLELAGRPWSTDALRQVWDIALDAFGSARLMFGSDWPITVTGAGYTGTADVVGALIDELSDAERDDLWWRTATRTYALNPQ